MDARPIRHRSDSTRQVVAIEMADASTAPQAEARVASALRWRDASDGRDLVLNLLVRDPGGLAEVDRVVRHVDAYAARHRDRPLMRVYCVLQQRIDHLLDQLAQADLRTPRIEVIRVLDDPLAPSRIAQLTDEAVAAETALLQFWTYFDLPSTSDLAPLARLLNDEVVASPGRALFRRFPIVEVQSSFTIDAAAPIAEFWSQHPPVQDASARSLQGPVATFFRLFELARLAHLGVDLSPIRSELDPEDDQVLAVFRPWLHRRGLLTSEPRVITSVLEHDVDLLADSHECQSPVFAFAGVAVNAAGVRSEGEAS